jgi:hypothetical protein
MKPTTKIDKKNSVRIIADTFRTNPSVNVVIGNYGNHKRKIQRLADYAFIKALNRNGAYVSSNNKGTALFFRSDIKVFSPKEMYYEVRFALSIPVKKVIQTLKRGSYIKKHRAYEKYYYFWFLGVQKGGDKAGFELKNALFKKAQDEELPILLETSVERNVHVYERYGFEVYHVWPDKANDINLWFMKWEPKQQ